ncbi:MAG: polyphosphate kinase 1 [Planctomycetota bacterium]
MSTHTGINSPRPDDTSVNIDLDDPSLYVGRDIAWLEFNRRVLAEAQRDELQLLERVKFLAIFTSNLDEFFMKRIALLKRRVAAGIESPALDGMSIRAQLERARALILEMQHQQAVCWQDHVRPALAREGVRVVELDELDERELARLDEWFLASVFPILTPLAVDQGHRFPFISNLSESLGVLVSPKGQDERLFARLKVPDTIQRLVALPRDPTKPIPATDDPTDARFVPVDQVIRRNLHEVFQGMDIVEVAPFRVTRASGVEQDGDEFEDLLETVEAELRHRRFAEPVRLELQPGASPRITEFLLDELELEAADVYERSGPLEYADLLELLSIDRPDLRERSWIPVVPARLRNEEADIFSIIRERDVFVHNPYDSFTASVERFVEAAADDPNVLAIKQTLYRTSRDSPFIESLIRAAEEGKQVACLVELRARFDEDKNLRFARQLEKHGVHVAYGVVGLKTHCKCSLVVRQEGRELRTYAHVGTGNYHPHTAQLYTDCGVLTCDPDITNDAVDLFNYLTGRSVNEGYRALLVAPNTMRPRFIELIEREAEHARAGKPARIHVKMNQLQDPQIIRSLFEASRAGVEIRAIVRGFCCLKPGVEGVSENIRVRSVIGRFLEHSRIFHFAAGSDDPLEGEWYIGSADWMNRNLDGRVESIAPVNDAEARRRLLRIMEVGFADQKCAWQMQPDGSYTRLVPQPGLPEDSPAKLGTFETLINDAATSVATAPH